MELWDGVMVKNPIISDLPDAPYTLSQAAKHLHIVNTTSVQGAKIHCGPYILLKNTMSIPLTSVQQEIHFWYGFIPTGFVDRPLSVTEANLLSLMQKWLRIAA